MAESPGPFDIDIRGKEALMKVSQTNYQVFPEECSLKYKSELESGKYQAGKPFMEFDPSATKPLPTHMQDFFNCVRNRQKPIDNEDEAFTEAVTCIMSVVSHFEERMVKWDAERQEIV